MKTPFGNTVAAIKLAELVENDPKGRRYVSSTLSELGSIMRHLFSITDTHTRSNLCGMIKQIYVQKTIQNPYLDPKVASFLQNVIITRCRSFKKCFDKT
jgi:hypothetical protein